MLMLLPMALQPTRDASRMQPRNCDPGGCERGRHRMRKVRRKCLLLHPATPYYPSPRGKFHTRGNMWSCTAGRCECCGPAGVAWSLCLCAVRKVTARFPTPAPNRHTSPPPRPMQPRLQHVNLPGPLKGGARCLLGAHDADAVLYLVGRAPCLIGGVLFCFLDLNHGVGAAPGQLGLALGVLGHVGCHHAAVFASRAHRANPVRRGRRARRVEHLVVVAFRFLFICT